MCWPMILTLPDQTSSNILHQKMKKSVIIDVLLSYFLPNASAINIKSLLRIIYMYNLLLPLKLLNPRQIRNLVHFYKKAHALYES